MEIPVFQIFRLMLVPPHSQNSITMNLEKTIETSPKKIDQKLCFYFVHSEKTYFFQFSSPTLTLFASKENTD